MKSIPFSPFPIHLMSKITKRFLGIGNFLSKIFPSTDVDLLRAEIELSSKEYLTIALFSAIFWTFFVTLLMIFVVTINPMITRIGFLFPSLTFLVVFFYIKSYPALIIAKKVKDIEKNLLFALRSMQIQVSSGISLFDSLVSISKGNYGTVSEEFKKAVKKISTGKSEIEALEELIIKNPSLYFRRIIWQITNASRSGSDIAATLKAIVEDLSYEKVVSIRKYGSQLNPMAMIYMMMAVIFPSLGVSFLLIISSFTQIQITKSIFWLILGSTAFFQFMFIGIIKSRRPVIE